MKNPSKLLPHSNFGWFCFGICGAALGLKCGTELQGIYFLLFCLSIFLLCYLFLFPPILTKPIESNLKWISFGILLFLFFANTNQITNHRQPKPFFRQFLVQELKKSPLSPIETRIVMGLLSGSTKEIPKDFKEMAKESGILHLFAASGLHLGIFIGSIQCLGNLIFTKHRWISILLSLCLSFLYLYLLNFPVSFVRAYLFAFFTLVSSLFYRKMIVSDLLFISSGVIAFFFFSDFLSIGFLLSFSAVFGIFYLKPILDQLFLPNSRSLLKENFTLTIVCSLCSFPVLVFYFHSFSYGGIWINYCLVPFAGILLPSLYVTLASISFLPNTMGVYIYDWIWTPASYLLSIFLKLFQCLSHYQRGYKLWNLEEPILFFVILSLFLICLLLYIHRTKRKPKQLWNYIICGFFFFFFPFTYWFPNDPTANNPIQMGKGYFTITSENQFYLFGNCPPYKRLEIPKGNVPITKILFESESCLQNALRLQKKENISQLVWNDRLNSNFGKVLGKEELQIQSSHRLGTDLTPFVSLFRFDGNPKHISSLLRSLKETETNKAKTHWRGILVLDFPPWKKKEAKDWITYQKLLGISNAWKILIVEDHFEIPLFHNFTNPGLL